MKKYTSETAELLISIDEEIHLVSLSSFLIKPYLAWIKIGS